MTVKVFFYSGLIFMLIMLAFWATLRIEMEAVNYLFFVVPYIFTMLLSALSSFLAAIKLIVDNGISLKKYTKKEKVLLLFGSTPFIFYMIFILALANVLNDIVN